MDVMIDIETLGVRPGSVIASIGAVAFDRGGTSRSFYTVIDLVGAQRCGCTIDADTVRWWLEQSDAARRGLFEGPRVSLRPALLDLTDFVRDAERVWAKPPSFDLVLLKSAYDLLGLPVPWRHYVERDARTLLDIAGVPGDAVPFEGVEHNALDDAKHQAALVLLAIDRLGRALDR